MNIVFLFLTRDDLNAIPRISTWLRQHPGPHIVLAFVNPHLAIDPSPDQVSLENRISEAMRSTLITSEERMGLEMELQKRWLKVPRNVLVSQLELLFKPFGITSTTGLTILSESFQADRVPELLTKIRPTWPPQIPLGQFLLVFPNQLPGGAEVPAVATVAVIPPLVVAAEQPKKTGGRPRGPVTDPVKKQAMLDRLAKGRETKKKNDEEKKRLEEERKKLVGAAAGAASVV